MAALSAQALLKQRILLTIGRTPVRSATILAQELGSPRPSTSRALHALKRDGLAEYHERTWRLTYAGQVEVARLNAQLAQQVERTGMSVDRLKQLVAASDDTVVRTAAAKLSSFTDVMSGHLASQHTRALAAMAAPDGLTTALNSLARTSGAAASFDRVMADTAAQHVAAITGYRQPVDHLLDTINSPHSMGGPAPLSPPMRAYEMLMVAAGMDTESHFDIFNLQNQLMATVAQAAAGAAGAGAKPASLQELAAKGLGATVTPLSVQNVVSDMVNALAPPDTLHAAIARLTEPWTFAEQLARSTVHDLFADVQAATAQVQISNLAWLQDTFGTGPSTQLRGLLSEANLALSRLTTDLDVLRNAPYTQRWAALVPDLITVPSTYATYYANSMETLARTYAQTPVPPAQVEHTLILPTATTAQLVGTARLILEEERDASSSTSSERHELAIRQEARTSVIVEGILIDEVTEWLSALGTRFVDHWEGAWDVLQSDTRNRRRMAAFSGRELITHILHYYAPNESFTPEEKRLGHEGKIITRKMRIKRTLGIGLSTTTSQVDLIDCMCEMYNIMSDQAHSQDDARLYSDTVLTGMLLGIGCLVRTLLGFRKEFEEGRNLDA